MQARFAESESLQRETPGEQRLAGMTVEPGDGDAQQCCGFRRGEERSASGICMLARSPHGPKVTARRATRAPWSAAT